MNYLTKEEREMKSSVSWICPKDYSEDKRFTRIRIEETESEISLNNSETATDQTRKW